MPTLKHPLPFRYEDALEMLRPPAIKDPFDPAVIAATSRTAPWGETSVTVADVVRQIREMAKTINRTPPVWQIQETLFPLNAVQPAQEKRSIEAPADLITDQTTNPDWGLF